MPSCEYVYAYIRVLRSCTGSQVASVYPPDKALSARILIESVQCARWPFDRRPTLATLANARYGVWCTRHTPYTIHPTPYTVRHTSTPHSQIGRAIVRTYLLDWYAFILGLSPIRLSCFNVIIQSCTCFDRFLLSEIRGSDGPNISAPTDVCMCGCAWIPTIIRKRDTPFSSYRSCIILIWKSGSKSPNWHHIVFGGNSSTGCGY